MFNTFFQQPLFDRITAYKPAKQRNSLNTVPYKTVMLSETQLFHVQCSSPTAVSTNTRLDSVRYCHRKFCIRYVVSLRKAFFLDLISYS